MTIIIPLPGIPRTKKNSQRIIEKNGKKAVLPSKAYEKYCNACLNYLHRCKLPKDRLPIDEAVNVQVLYYMPNHRRVDLVNLLEATNDILVAARILKDDNSEIVAGHDGSRVLVDEHYPRAVVYIEYMKDRLLEKYILPAEE